MYVRLSIIIILKLLTWATLKKKRGATALCLPLISSAVKYSYMPVARMRLPQPLHEPGG